MFWCSRTIDLLSKKLVLRALKVWSPSSFFVLEHQNVSHHHFIVYHEVVGSQMMFLVVTYYYG